MTLSSVRNVLFLSLFFSLSARAELPFPFEVPSSVQELERSLGQDAHFVFLSAPKRINNEIRHEKRERVKGTAHEYLFWIENNYPVKSVHEYFLRWLKASGELLYSCEQRGCESSSVWANEIFRQPKLYGRDSDQYYLVGQYVLEGKQYWVSVYSVLNGRRHGYSYVRLIETEVSDRGPIIQGQSFTAAGAAQADFSAILRDLERAPKSHWWLVVYSAMPAQGGVSARLPQMEKQAQEVAQVLVKQRQFPESRQRIHLAGPFNEPDSKLKADIWYRLYVQP